MHNEVYFSTDVETDGPIPGPNSMMSLGCAAFQDGKMVSTFYANLLPIEGSIPDPRTTEWWKTQPKAFVQTQTDRREPEFVMQAFSDWVTRVGGRSPVFVGYPAGFDFLFVYWYLIKFTGKSPFSFSALDIKTYAAAKLNRPYREVTKKTMPKHWFKGCGKHTHNALDDAIEQGILFMNIKNEN